MVKISPLSLERMLHRLRDDAAHSGIGDTPPPHFRTIATLMKMIESSLPKAFFTGERLVWLQR
jgi:hypothetical protein